MGAGGAKRSEGSLTEKGAGGGCEHAPSIPPPPPAIQSAVLHSAIVAKPPMAPFRMTAGFSGAPRLLDTRPAASLFSARHARPAHGSHPHPRRHRAGAGHAAAGRVCHLARGGRRSARGHPLLYRRHARLTINYDHLLLEDLGSSNGTFVNQRRVAEPTRLFPNQSIRLGPDITLEVRRQRAPSEPGVSLAPAQAAIARHLPAELLAERRYAIGGVVAQGGMGAILDARQSAMKRTVA